MRIGFVELVLLLFIASITVGPNVALFVDRWLRRAQRTSAAAARRKAQLEAQAAIEREALMTRFRVASNIFALLMLAALAYGLLLRPIDTPPKAYTAPDVRQDTGAAQTALSADSKDSWKLGGYLGVDCVRTQDGLVYAAAYNGAAMKKRQSDLVRTDGGHYAAILSVEGELTSFAFDADGDLWLTVVTPSGGALCRARHDSWGTSVEQVVTQIDGAPLGVLSAVETGPDGKVYFAVSTEAAAKNGLESALRTELIAHTGTGCVYVYDPSARTVEQVLGGVAGAAGLALSPDGRSGPLGGWPNAVRFRPRESLRLECGRRRPGADRRRQKLRELCVRPAGIPRRIGAGRGRHPLYQLPLDPQRLAGKARGQHPSAGHRPAGR